VEAVYVNAEYRGYGIATRLLHHAGTLHGAPLVGTDEYTHAGFAWARKRGLKPKRGDQAWVTDADMARMTARLIHVLWGGGHSTALVESVADWQQATVPETADSSSEET
jgi:GNAT superfamily N-acetyltransferase